MWKFSDLRGHCRRWAHWADVACRCMGSPALQQRLHTSSRQQRLPALGFTILRTTPPGRLMQVTTLPSGMRVASQYTPDESLACLCHMLGLARNLQATDGDNAHAPGDCHSRRLDRCRQPLRDQGPCNPSTACNHTSRTSPCRRTTALLTF